jgi:outer membrane biosynthesis protein TonB
LNGERAPQLKASVMRLVLISLALFAYAGAVSAQRFERCDGFASKYRDLENEAITKVAAHYPSERMRVKARVTVLIKVDRRGDVVSAHVICGHPLLAASSVAAARSWKFQRT